MTNFIQKETPLFTEAKNASETAPPPEEHVTSSQMECEETEPLEVTRSLRYWQELFARHINYYGLQEAITSILDRDLSFYKAILVSFHHQSTEFINPPEVES